MNAAKGALLAFTCILLAGLGNATADELLDLETRDLAEMKTVSGITVVFDPGKINMVFETWDHIPAEAKSAVNAGGRAIFVKEGVTTIKDAINAIRRQNRSP